MTTILVLIGGEPGPPGFRDADFLIAADSGLHRAGDRHVDALIGDLDSVDPEALERALSEGVAVTSYPADKDLSDLELALEEAMERRPDRVIVEGGFGDRLDHLLNVANVLTSRRWSNSTIEWWDTEQRAVVVHEELVIEGRKGELVSLLPFGGTAHGVTLSGFRYGLDDDDLEAGSGRGLSNVVSEDRAVVRLGDGVILAIFPRITHSG